MSKQIHDCPLVRLCGLWEHKGRGGAHYLTGKLNQQTRLVAFKNANKTAPNQPDYFLFIRADAGLTERAPEVTETTPSKTADRKVGGTG